MSFTNLFIDFSIKPIIVSATTVAYQGITLNTATVGLNGLDAGTVSAFKPYFIHSCIISGTAYLFASLNKTTPLLPNGVVGFKWTGWCFVANDINAISIIVKDTNWDRIPLVNVSGTWTVNTVYTGFLKRTGSDAEIYQAVNLTGAPNATQLAFNFPANILLETTKLVYLNGNQAKVGDSHTQVAGTGGWEGMALILAAGSSPQIYPYVNTDAGGAGATGITNLQPGTYAASNGAEINYKVPIFGWSANDI